MEYYLVQLAYTAESWKQQISKPLAVEDRLNAVEKLIKYLGGRIVIVDCPDCDEDPPDDGRPVFKGKFVGTGDHDLVALLAFPDQKKALAFKMAVAAEPGVREIKLTPLVPMHEALKVMSDADKARQATNYSAPGGANQSWAGPKSAKSAARRAKAK